MTNQRKPHATRNEVEQATLALINQVIEINPGFTYVESAAWAIDGICEQYLLGEADERHLREMFGVDA